MENLHRVENYYKRTRATLRLEVLIQVSINEV